MLHICSHKLATLYKVVDVHGKASAASALHEIKHKVCGQGANKA